MKRRQWTAKEELTIVLQGLKSEISVAGLCNQHQISQSQYYKWRDRLLAGVRRRSPRGLCSPCGL